MEKQTIPEGYKQTGVGMIPEDWESVSIGELITDLRGGAPFKPSDFTKYGVKVLPKGGVIRGGLLKVLEKDQQFCSPSFASKYAKNQVNEKYTIVVLRDLVPSGPSIGLMVKIPDPVNYVLAQGVYGFLTKNQSVSAYLIQYSNTNKYRRAANEIMVGSTQVHITNGAFKELKIALPSIEKEQTAIANALSDVDALIAGLEKLIAKKQAIKTATMQQLLTGRTRLPEFANHTDGTPKGYKQTELGEIPEDWETFQLQDIFSLKNGFAFKGNDFGNNGPIVLTPGNFQLDGGLYFEPRNTKRYKGIYPKGFEFNEGDLVIVMTDLTPDCNLLGKPAIIQSEEKILHNQRIGKVIIFRSEWNKLYLYYTLLSPIYLREIKNAATGSTVRHTSPSTILNVWVFAPSLLEQAAIANILSDMDEEIQSLQQRLDKTRQIKQGMMQELLTGKTRLI